jgi:hypothetical protein
MLREQPLRLAQGIGTRAGAGIIPALDHHARLNGIAFKVTVASN